ncbi:MAG: AIPR family protein [Erysipelotrichales bacterium]|nr:AIPR family protein [Erysipelotrichales bacterium]
MTTTYQRYYQAIESELVELINKYDYENKSVAFAHYYIKYTFNLDDDEVSEYITDGRNDQGIDAIYIEGEKGEEVVNFFQFKFPEIQNIERSSLEQETVLKFTNAYKKFIGYEDNDAITFNESIIESQQRYNEIQNMKCIHNLFIIQFSSSDENENYQSFKNDINQIGKFTGNKITTFYKNASSITSLYDSIYSGDFPDIIVNYTDVSNSFEDDISKVFILKTKLKDLYISVKDYYSMILDSNIRYAIGTGNSEVNKGMYSSIVHEPENFFLYNNGVTILCDDCNIKNSTNREFSIIKGRIVNGGQTLGVIKEYFETFENSEDIVKLENATVLVRVEQIKIKSIIDSVVVNLNKQNKTLKSFSFSNNPMMISLQEEINRKTNYFIEIKDNEFEFKKVNSPVSVKSKQRKDVIKIERIVQMFASFYDSDDRGSTVKNSKEKIITTDFMRKIENDFNYENILDCLKYYESIYEYIFAYRSAKKMQNPNLITDKLGVKVGEITDFIYLNTGDFILLYVLGKIINEINRHNEKIKVLLNKRLIDCDKYLELQIKIESDKLIKETILDARDFFLSRKEYSITDVSRMTRNAEIHKDLAKYLIEKFTVENMQIIEYSKKYLSS